MKVILRLVKFIDLYNDLDMAYTCFPRLNQELQKRKSSALQIFLIQNPYRSHYT